MARKKLDKVSVTLGKMLKARGFERSLSEYRVAGIWKSAVGEAIARHAHPHSLHGKKMVVTVDSPAWMQQLSLLKPEIISKLNDKLGKEAVTGITLRLGAVDIPKKAADVPRMRTVLDAEECAEIESFLRGVGDVDVRAALRRVMEKDFLSRKTGRQ